MTNENVPDSWEDFCSNDVNPATFLKPITVPVLKLPIVVSQPVQPQPAHPAHPAHPAKKPNLVAKVKKAETDGNEGDDDDELEYELEKMDKKMGIHFTLR